MINEKLDVKFGFTDRIQVYLRIFNFAVFQLLSIRLVAICLEYVDERLFVYGLSCVLLFAILAWWKFDFVFICFICFVPFIGGIQTIGVMEHAPIQSFLFAILYNVWIIKKIVVIKKADLESNNVSMLVDTLISITIISMMLALSRYPIDFIFYRLRFASVSGQIDPFYFIEATYTFLQGLFFYRLFVNRFSNSNGKKIISTIVYSHAIIIILFALIQEFLHIPNLVNKIFIYSPLHNIHSFGSYLSTLFFIICGYCIIKKQKLKALKIIVCIISFCLIMLSGSNGALIAIILTGILFLSRMITRKYFIIICLATLGGIFLINVFSDLYVERRDSVHNRYARSLVYDNAKKAMKSRIALWERAFEIIKRYPVQGIGLSSFYRKSLEYHPEDNRQYKGWKENTHNYYLQIASELGLTGLLLFILICYFSIQESIKAEKKQKEDIPLIWGIICGVVAYLITLFIDHSLILSTQQFLFYFVISALYFYSRKNTDQMKAITVNCIVIICVFLISGMIAHAKSNDFRVSSYGFYPEQNFEALKQTEGLRNDTMKWTMKKSMLRFDKNIRNINFKMYISPHLFVLREKGQENIVANGDFQEGTQKWFVNRKNKIAFSSDGMNDNCMKAPTKKARQSRIWSDSFSLNAGRYYKVALWMRTEKSSRTKTRFSLSNGKKEIWVQNKNNDVYFNIGTRWQKLEFIFLCPENSGKWIFRIFSKDEIKDNAFFYDEITVTEMEQVTEEPIVVYLKINDRPSDKFEFTKSGIQDISYQIEENRNKGTELFIETSKTFNPYLLGMTGNIRMHRPQGVLIADISAL